jgi:uncharacterized protein YjbJ (UPF0337 family)
MEDLYFAMFSLLARFRVSPSMAIILHIYFADPARKHIAGSNAERRITMAGKMDQAKGRVKEAAGALSGNQRLKQEGKMDQAAGKIKSAATKTVDAVKKAFSRKKQK